MICSCCSILVFAYLSCSTDWLFILLSSRRLAVSYSTYCFFYRSKAWVDSILDVFYLKSSSYLYCEDASPFNTVNYWDFFSHSTFHCFSLSSLSYSSLFTSFFILFKSAEVLSYFLTTISLSKTTLCNSPYNIACSAFHLLYTSSFSLFISSTTLSLSFRSNITASSVFLLPSSCAALLSSILPLSPSATASSTFFLSPWLALRASSILSATLCRNYASHSLRQIWTTSLMTS